MGSGRTFGLFTDMDRWLCMGHGDHYPFRFRCHPHHSHRHVFTLRSNVNKGVTASFQPNTTRSHFRVFVRCSIPRGPALNATQGDLARFRRIRLGMHGAVCAAIARTTTRPPAPHDYGVKWGQKRGAHFPAFKC